jgi:hypothetical protein
MSEQVPTAVGMSLSDALDLMREIEQMATQADEVMRAHYEAFKDQAKTGGASGREWSIAYGQWADFRALLPQDVCVVTRDGAAFRAVYFSGQYDDWGPTETTREEWDREPHEWYSEWVEA